MDKSPILCIVLIRKCLLIILTSTFHSNFNFAEVDVQADIEFLSAIKQFIIDLFLGIESIGDMLLNSQGHLHGSIGHNQTGLRLLEWLNDDHVVAVEAESFMGGAYRQHILLIMPREFTQIDS